jgi:hypothetical protein
MKDSTWIVMSLAILCTLAFGIFLGFALALDEGAPQFHHSSGKVFGQLVLRRDRVSRIKAAPGADRCFTDHMGASHQYSFTWHGTPQ